MTAREAAELTARLQRVLSKLGRMLRREAPSVLGPGALSVLGTLAGDGPLRPTELATREGVRPPTMTRMLTLLEEGGHVARTVDPADRRASLIELTPLGRSTLDETRSARAGRLSDHIERLSPRQRQRLAEALPVLEALAGLQSTVDSADVEPAG